MVLSLGKNLRIAWLSKIVTVKITREIIDRRIINFNML